MQELCIILPWRSEADAARVASARRVAVALGFARARVESVERYRRAVALVLDWSTVRDLYRAFAVLSAANRSVLRADRSLPPLYRAGVRYAPEARGQEDWVTVPVLYEVGRGDCDDLGGARVAELRQRGERAHGFFKRSRVGWHVQVRRASGAIEDPSRVLGMPEPREAA